MYWDKGGSGVLLGPTVAALGYAGPARAGRGEVQGRCSWAQQGTAACVAGALLMLGGWLGPPGCFLWLADGLPWGLPGLLLGQGARHADGALFSELPTNMPAAARRRARAAAATRPAGTASRRSGAAGAAGAAGAEVGGASGERAPARPLPRASGSRPGGVRAACALLYSLLLPAVPHVGQLTLLEPLEPLPSSCRPLIYI